MLAKDAWEVRLAKDAWHAGQIKYLPIHAGQSSQRWRQTSSIAFLALGLFVVIPLPGLRTCRTNLSMQDKEKMQDKPIHAGHAGESAGKKRRPIHAGERRLC